MITEASIRDGRVSSDGLRPLGPLDRLQRLILAHDTAVDDASLAGLPALPRLELLDLQSTGVTDAGLERLETFTSLRVVKVNGTKVTSAGLARLRKARPDLRIDKN